nr:MAG TPA: hypothetical protein [Caudoviricetes sp.]
MKPVLFLIKWIPSIMGCISIIQLALGAYDWSLGFLLLMCFTYAMF